MKILWVKDGKLWPVDTGGKIRSFNVLRHLARNHQVTLLSFTAVSAILGTRQRSPLTAGAQHDLRGSP